MPQDKASLWVIGPSFFLGLVETMTVAPSPVDVHARARTLISLDEACRRAARYASPIDGWETVSVADALDRILVEQICARIPLPPFDQSAMDGYAFAASAVDRVETELPIVSRIVAGGPSSPPLPFGAAARIFTGAPIPSGADTVAMQEHVQHRDSRLIVEGPVRPGSNVRHRGEDVAKGDVLLEIGQFLDARHLALLSAQGLSHVNVMRRLRVAVVSTGDELRQPGETLGESAIFDSNRPMLLALVRQAGLEAIDGGCIADNANAIALRLSALADSADLVVTTGGASIGEADYSAAALAASGAAFEVLTMALKPGKPAVVGRFANASYLGLPGNPVSALVTWLIVGNAMVAALCGMKPRRRLGATMTSISRFERSSGRTEFAPARLVMTEAGTRVEILGRGGSARLKPLIHADGLAEIAATAGDLNPEDSVLFHPFRNGFTI
jgi:molybdopterin molybdotransferase